MKTNMNIIHKRHIFYIYKYIYYSRHIVSQILIRMFFLENIHEYIFKSSNILKYLKKKPTSGYCYLPIWRLWTRHQNLFVTFHTANQVEYVKKNPFFLYFTINGESWV